MLLIIWKANTGTIELNYIVWRWFVFVFGRVCVCDVFVGFWCININVYVRLKWIESNFMPQLIWHSIFVSEDEEQQTEIVTVLGKYIETHTLFT